MAMTEDRVMNTGSTLEVDELEEMWEAPPRRATTATRPRRNSPTRALLLAWSLIFGGILLFAPAPDNAAPIPAWEMLIGLAFLAVVTMAFVGLAKARPWAFKVSMGAALLGVAAGIACNVVDHHTGTWWVVETAGFSTLALMTSAAARRSK
jgi:hypothetical protein